MSILIRGGRVVTAVDDYVAEVRSGEFPSEKESFFLKPKKRPKARKPWIAYAPRRTRTFNLLIKSQLLCQLS